MNARKGILLFSEQQNENAIERALALPRQEIILQVKESGLKGRGGAGFPTGTKWILAAAAVDDRKYVVCNADEGEPGTFKDRVLLDEYPESVFGGMVIGGYAIGAHKGFVYLRGEYRYLLKKLNARLESMRESSLLGNAILGTPFSFDIEIRLGSGAYVCGEETALIESLEGNRGEARNRPPFPVNTGYLGHPTIVNNVETFACVTTILNRGTEWFKTHGTASSTGTKLVSVSGDCEAPGVYEIPFGMTVAQLLSLVGARDTKAVQIGGAAGRCIPAAEFERAIAFEDIPTGGSVIVFNSSRDMLRVLKNFMEFFVEESCGQCSPCRIGNRVLLDGIGKIESGTCSQRYLRELMSLGESMMAASKCGLGQSSPTPFISIMTHFKQEIFAQW